MHARIDPVAPPVELELVVELVGEAPPGLEVRAHEAMRALQRALGLRVARLEDQPADPELATEAREGVGRLPAAGVDRALAVPDQRLGQRPEPAQAAAHAEQQVRRLLGEHQRARE
jgi:hypothetical protein